MDQLLGNLQKLGFSQYESRAYVACLRAPRATAYELAKHSGIPPSKIYEVVDRLVAKDLLVKVEEAGSCRYVGLEPAEVMERYRRSYTTILEEVDEQLRSVAAPAEPGEQTYVWNLTGREEVLSRCRELVEEAAEEIYLAVWPEELAPLMEALRSAERRGVVVVLCLYGDDEPAVGRVFHHATEQIAARDGRSRRLILVTDGRESLLGYFPPDVNPTGHWSRNPGFVQMTKDYIRHDIWIIEVMERFDEHLSRVIGPGRDKMRRLLDSDLPALGPRDGPEPPGRSDYPGKPPVEYDARASAGKAGKGP